MTEFSTGPYSSYATIMYTVENGQRFINLRHDGLEGYDRKSGTKPRAVTL